MQLFQPRTSTTIIKTEYLIHSLHKSYLLASRAHLSTENSVVILLCSLLLDPILGLIAELVDYPKITLMLLFYCYCMLSTSGLNTRVTVVFNVFPVLWFHS